MDECLVVGSPVGDFELLFCRGILPEGQKWGDLILIAVKSSIYSTKSQISKCLLLAEIPN